MSEMKPEIKHYQCRHIFTGGHRCGSRSLRNEVFCYYHHTTRRPAPHRHAPANPHSPFDLPLPEDRSAIQSAIGQILRRIAANQLDNRRAGLLLYGLQIASLNLPKPLPAAEPVPQVEEITHDPTHGELAPATEYTEKSHEKSVAEILNERWNREEAEHAAAKAAALGRPTILPTLNAVAEPTPNCLPSRPHSRQAVRELWPGWRGGADQLYQPDRRRAGRHRPRYGARPV